ncbi:MAG: Na+/H+ antiporter subunit E [Halobacteria archaeon]
MKGSIPGWSYMTAVLAVLWMLFHLSVTSVTVNVLNLLIGYGVGLILIYPFRSMYDGNVELEDLTGSVAATVILFLIFVKDVLVSNVDVAKRVLLPWYDIDPEVVVIPLEIESQYGVTSIANAITLTPGTLTMDYDEERHALYVHSMAGDDVVEPVKKWEKFAVRVFESRDLDKTEMEVER